MRGVSSERDGAIAGPRRRASVQRALALGTVALLLTKAQPLLAQAAPLGGDGRASDQITDASRGSPQNTLPDPPPVPGDAPQMREVEQAIDAMAKRTPATSAELGRPGRVGVLDRKRPIFDAMPIRIPGFDLFVEPRVSVTGDTNVLRRSGGSADVYAEPGARVEARSTWSQHSLKVTADGVKRVHATFTNEDFWTATAAVVGRLDVTSHLQLTGEVRGGRDVDQRGNVGTVSGTRSPVSFDFLDLTASARYQTGRFAFDGTVRYQDRDFLDSISLAGDPIDMQFRSASRRLFIGGVSYRVSPDLSLATSLRYDTLGYSVSTGRNRDSDGLRALVGVQGDLTRLLRGHVLVGVITRNYADSSLDSTQNLTYDVELDWLVTDLSTIQLSATRDVLNSSNRATPVELRTTLAASIDHELLRNLIVTATAQHFEAAYANIGPKDSSDMLVLSARWLVNPRLEINGRVVTQQRRAAPALNAFDYDSARLTLGVRVRL